MPREYRHIKQYEKEILELKEKGLTNREIGEKFGFSKEQIKGVLQRNRRNEEKLSCKIVPKKRGRPAKNSVVTEDDRGVFVLPIQFGAVHIFLICLLRTLIAPAALSG